MFNSILFLGRKNCIYSNKLKKYLAKNTNKFFYFESNSFGDKLELNKFKNKKFDFIFSYRSFVIIKENLIKKCVYAPINFHPGPPEYRGTGCVNYALYDNSKFYGCTSHIISSKIDYGKIIDVKKFRIGKNSSVDSVLKKTHKLMFERAKFIIHSLLKNPNNINKFMSNSKKNKWSKKIKTLKDLEQFYIIDKNISKSEFIRKIRATNTNKFKPYILLHNNKFVLN